MTHPTPRLPNSRRGRPAARAGFSFVEVLFAVMILGIGFIMIAGIFPAAMTQTAATQQDTVAAAAARGAAVAIGAAGSNPAFQAAPADGNIHPLNKDQLQLVVGNLILPEDPRFAYVPLLLRKEPPAAGAAPPPLAQVLMAIVQVRDGRAAFDQRDVIQVNPGTVNAYGTLTPHHVKVRLTEGGDLDPDVCELVDGIGVGAAAPGAMVVIAMGPTAPGNDDAGRPATGRVYRLGSLVAGATNKYELVPGNDMSVYLGADGLVGGGDDKNEDIGTPRDAYLIGQGLAKPGVDVGNAPAFSGGNMVVGVYSTFVGLR